MRAWSSYSYCSHQWLQKKHPIPSAGNVRMLQSTRMQQVPEPATDTSSVFLAAGKWVTGKQWLYLQGTALSPREDTCITRATKQGGVPVQTSKMNINRKEARDKKDHKVQTVHRYYMFIAGSVGIMGIYKWVQGDNVYWNMSPEGEYVFKNYLLYIA